MNYTQMWADQRFHHTVFNWHLQIHRHWLVPFLLSFRHVCYEQLKILLWIDHIKSRKNIVHIIPFFLAKNKVHEVKKKKTQPRRKQPHNPPFLSKKLKWCVRFACEFCFYAKKWKSKISFLKFLLLQLSEMCRNCCTHLHSLVSFVNSWYNSSHSPDD